MWFIKFYLISTILTIIIFIINAIAIANNIKRKGYKRIKKGKSSIAELIIRFIPLLIPFFNIIMVLALVLNFDESVDSVIQKQIEQNEIEIRE